MRTLLGALMLAVCFTGCKTTAPNAEMTATANAITAASSTAQVVRTKVQTVYVRTKDPALAEAVKDIEDLQGHLVVAEEKLNDASRDLSRITHERDTAQSRLKEELEKGAFTAVTLVFVFTLLGGLSFWAAGYFRYAMGAVGVLIPEKIIGFAGCLAFAILASIVAFFWEMLCGIVEWIRWLL